ncbi:MAG TPA: adenylate/guanylate cyclase domain-containing protein [Lapillicoccus sp.]|nr:adenylate/guanylate cyclase domain-containing protein [Lapillicoccus sp.]
MLKLVTVLFADVVGSTARAEVLYPEDVRALMADFFAVMSQEIRAEGGTIEKFVGDAIMAVFGVPHTHEDDAVRAVRAAQRMHDRLKDWNTARPAAERLELRIGLNTGDVIASGADDADQLIVTGDAVNVAARLQQAAAPGTVVLGERTARAVRSQYDLQPVDAPLALKGKSDAVAAWVLGSARSAEEPRGVPGVEAPLVGRDVQLTALRATYERVRREGRPELVTVLGDAGIGKSRLVLEFLAELTDDTTKLVGRCAAQGQGVTLRPVAEILKAEAAVLDSDPAELAVAKIRQLVTTLDPALVADPSRTTRALAATLGLLSTDAPGSPLSPSDTYRELVGAWLALLGSYGRRGPVVVVIEDLHWADPMLLDVLDELAERLDGPILFVGTSRPDLLRERPDWGGGRRGFSSLPLEPLAPAETARLVSLLLGDDALTDRVRHRVLERSEGNPFFLEEIVRHLIDDGVLERQGETWRARPGIDDVVAMPDNVHGVILARLDLLSAEERRAAQRAAVVGRTFWDGAVSTLADIDDLEACLRTLRRREFVVERLSSSIAGQREFAFKHVLIRDVAYESLPRRLRGQMHVQTAAWIERTSGEGTVERAELLASHYDAAFSYLHDDDLRRRARAHLLAAARQAQARFAIREGDRFAQRAVDLSDGSAERVEALEALGDLHDLAFHGDAAWRTYGQALAELSSEDPAYPRLAGKAAEYSVRWLGALQHVPALDEARHLIDAGLRAGPPSGGDRAQLLIDRGFLLTSRERRQDAESEAATLAALTAAEELGDADLISAALDLRQTHERGRGRLREAYRTAQRREALVPRMTDPKEIGDVHAMAAMVDVVIGRYEEAEAYATTCIEQARGFDAGSYLHGLAWRVISRLVLGDWNGLLADQAELERIAEQDPRDLPAGYLMGAYGSAALCHALRGETARADHYIDVGLRSSERRLAARPDVLEHTPALAVAMARRGRVAEALPLIPLIPNSSTASRFLEARCEIATLDGDVGSAAELVAAARAEAEFGGQLALPLFADRLEARVAATADQPERAAELLERSAAGFAALGAVWQAAWSRLLLAETVISDDPRRAHEELASALPVFERLGSVLETERARALLADARPA